MATSSTVPGGEDNYALDLAVGGGVDGSNAEVNKSKLVIEWMCI